MDGLTLLVSGLTAIIALVSLVIMYKGNIEKKKRDRERYRLSLISSVEASYSNETNKEKIADASNKLICCMEFIDAYWPFMENSFPEEIHKIIHSLKNRVSLCEKYAQLLNTRNLSTSALFTNEILSDDLRLIIRMFPRDLRPLMLYYYILFPINHLSIEVIREEFQHYVDKPEFDLQSIDVFLKISEEVKLYELEYTDQQVQHIRDYMNDSIKEKRNRDNIIDEIINDACGRIPKIKNNAGDNTERHSLESCNATSKDTTSSISSLS